MIFESFGAFMHMGGHGQFVWCAYGIATLVIAYNVIQPILMRRKVIALNKQRIAREGKL
ncbi:MAG TPA: heme exporter protein CcmD [Gammaproteobacteria bacterium]|nr:heme exporter protein CcmD [Gammaproteobacteria bacterium]